MFYFIKASDLDEIIVGNQKVFLFLQSDEVLNQTIGQDCNLGINRFHYLEFPIISYWRPLDWPSFFCQYQHIKSISLCQYH